MILSNRAAITVKATQAFIDWFNEVDPAKNHRNYEPMLLEDDDEGTVYLVPQWYLDSERDEILQDSYRIIMRGELSGWYTDESLWPPEKEWTYALFKKWFQVIHSSLIIDLLDEKIEREKY